MNFTMASHFFLGWLIAAFLMALFGFPPTVPHIAVGAVCSVCWGIYKRKLK